MRCKLCPRALENGPCRGESVPRFCQLVEMGRDDYIRYLKNSTAPPAHKPARETRLRRYYRLASNFLNAVYLHIKSGFQHAPREVQKSRLLACRDCPFNKNGRCERCGCILALKVKWASSQCPADPPRWDRPAASSDCGCR
jgi:hypothetical protein